jgi:hypothetical protein
MKVSSRNAILGSMTQVVLDSRPSPPRTVMADAMTTVRRSLNVSPIRGEGNTNEENVLILEELATRVEIVPKSVKVKAGEMTVRPIALTVRNDATGPPMAHRRLVRKVKDIAFWWTKARGDPQLRLFTLDLSTEMGPERNTH